MVKFCLDLHVRNKLGENAFVLWLDFQRFIEIMEHINDNRVLGIQLVLPHPSLVVILVSARHIQRAFRAIQ
jgi:hypothetical protein